MTTTPDVFGGSTVDSKFPGDDLLQDAFKVLVADRSSSDVTKMPRDPGIRIRFLRVVVDRLALEERRSRPESEDFCRAMNLHLGRILTQIPFVQGNDTPDKAVRLWVAERLSLCLPPVWGDQAREVCEFLNRALSSVLFGESSEVLNLIRRAASRMTADFLKQWMMLPETPDQVVKALALIWIRKFSASEILAWFFFPDLSKP